MNDETKRPAWPVMPAGRDVLEAVDTLQRWLEMRAEDERRENA